MNDNLRGYFFMLVLGVQFGFQPLLQKWFVDEGLDKKVLVCIGEFFKIITAFLLLLGEGSFSQVRSQWTMKKSVSVAALPAILYAVQNYCMQLAYSNLDSITINLLNQTKILFTAIAVYFLVGKKQTKMQVFALLLLFVSAYLLSSNSNSSNNSDDKAETNFKNGKNWLLLGFLPCLIASIISGLASALSQRALQSQNRNSYLFSMELAVFTSITLISSIVLNAEINTTRGITGYIIDGKYNEIGKLWNFEKYTRYTFLTFFINTLGGISVGQITKYAGAVKKVYSVIGGLLLTAVLGIYLETQPLTWEIQISFALTLISLYIHTKFSSSKPKTE